MRKALAVALATVLVCVPATFALADAADTDTPTPTTELDKSPPTTSEYGTESQIVIALDDNGDIVPGTP